jgi:DNA-binding NtrC family response regulator
VDKIKVLLVDDEEDLSFVLAERLIMRGFNAHGVTDSESAIALIDKSNFDVIVVDVKMPGMGGIELMKQILLKRPTTKVILFTGHGSHLEGEEGLSEGAFDYLIKPVKIEDLVQKIKQAAGN